nr:MAG: hypothetical protein [Lake Baikal virophage 11]
MSEILDTLVRFPTTMQWRGEFDPLQQYIKNDVVTDIFDKATYICIETSATIGVDPSSSPDWFLFTGSVSGIHTVDIVGGLSNVGTATQPTIQNDGVRQLVAGSNVFLTGTPQNTVINSLAVSGFIGGLGISVSGNEITNSGIRTIGTGGGLYLETPPPDAKISQNNILSVTAEDGIVNIGTAQNPILENDYVRSLVLVNLTNNGTASLPLLANGGVESVSNVDGTLQITGTTAKTIACSIAPESIIFSSMPYNVAGWPVLGNQNLPIQPSASFSVSSLSPLLQSAITNNIPYNVTINLTAIIRISGNLAPISTNNSIALYDSTTGNSAPIRLQAISGIVALPTEISFGLISFDTSYLVSNGLTTITEIQFFPFTTGQRWDLISYGTIYGSMVFKTGS